MKLIQTLSTRPAFNQLHGYLNFFEFLASLKVQNNLLKKRKEQRFLVTDSAGAKICEDLKLEFDEIYTYLDLDHSKRDFHFWAGDKFITYEKFDNFIHIDNDVLLFEGFKFKEFEDVLVQSNEKKMPYEKFEMKENILKLKLPLFENHDSYCVGILGLKNNEIKNKYIESYLLYEKANKITDYTLSTIFLVYMEQIFLNNLLLENEVKPVFQFSNFGENEVKISKNNFCHMIGDNKKDGNNRVKLFEMLNEVDLKLIASCYKKSIKY